MKGLRRFFAAAALGGAAALAFSGCGFVQGVVTATAGNNNPFTGMISAKEAFRLAQQPAEGQSLSPDRKKIVRIIRDLQKSNLGKEMTARAAEKGYYYAIHNHITGGGVHISWVRLIALELIDDGARPHEPAHDFSKDEEFEKVVDWFRKVMGHELTHMYQHLVWDNMTPPPGLNSFDRKLWSLALEGQADLFAQVVRAQTDSPAWNDLSAVGNEWPRMIFENYLEQDDFHPRTYGIAGTRCDDGRAMTADEFNAAFGAIPGNDGNFLRDVLRSRDDIYRVFSRNEAVLAAAQQGGCPMTPPPPEEPLVPAIS